MALSERSYDTQGRKSRISQNIVSISLQKCMCQHTKPALLTLNLKTRSHMNDLEKRNSSIGNWLTL